MSNENMVTYETVVEVRLVDVHVGNIYHSETPHKYTGHIGGVNTFGYHYLPLGHSANEDTKYFAHLITCKKDLETV